MGMTMQERGILNKIIDDAMHSTKVEFTMMVRTAATRYDGVVASPTRIHVEVMNSGMSCAELLDICNEFRHAILSNDELYKNLWQHPDIKNCLVRITRSDGDYGSIVSEYNPNN